MLKIKQRALGIIVCIAIILGQVSAFALTPVREYVTREQAVALILDAVGLGALNETPDDLSRFSDANEVSPEYVKSVGIAVSNGILAGANGNLLPKQDVTRLEFAMLLSRSIRELPDLYDTQQYSDVPEAAFGDVKRLAGAGLMFGYGDGTFGINDYLTVSQLEAILGRVKNLSSVRPQDDFYYALNYDWLTNTKLPSGYPGMTSFDDAGLSNNEKLKAIVKEVTDKTGSWRKGSKEQKIADFYSTIVDTESRNKQGIEPIKPYLDRIKQVDSAQKMLSLFADFENEIGINPLFGFSPSVDLKDSNRYSLYGSGISPILPASYLNMDNLQINMLYESFIAQLFMLTGDSQEVSQEKAKNILALEKLLAQNSMTNEESSKVENIYNPYTVDQFADMFPNVDLNAYMKELGYKDVKSVIVVDPKLMQKTGELVSDENLDILKTYSIYRIVISTASYLSKDLENALTAFNSTFLGISGSLSEEDIAFNLLNSVMGSYLGRIYIEKYFTESAREDVTDIVKEIISTYEKRIQKLDWMSETTKKTAISKLKAIKLKIGYPDTWEDPLKNIEIRSYEDNGSLLGNIFAITRAQTQEAKRLLSKKVDKDSWIVPPHTVNAFYNSTSNEIIFPAGILQAPFYDENASREQNLGGIGTIIAHEITHAFDNNGAQFDKNGNMVNWWTNEDYAAFRRKCTDVINLFDGLEIAPGCIVSGELTVSENIADIGAMACILEIAGQMPDANYEELFESYARIWRFTGTNQIYKLLTLQDVHAPNKFRVNQVLRNFKEFYETYGIQPEDRMYLSPEERVTVW